MTAPAITVGARVRYRRAVLRALRLGARSWPARMIGDVAELRTVDGALFAAVMPDDFDQPKWIAVADLERG